MECKKVKYSTEAFAMQDVARIEKVSKRDKVPVRAYLCTRCKGWHLTSSEDINVFKSLIESLKKENEDLILENKKLKTGQNREENIIVKTNQQIKILNKAIGKNNEIISKLRKSNKELASEIYHIKNKTK